MLEIRVVDGEELVAGIIGTFLENTGHRASVFMDGAEDLDALQKGKYDLVAVDLAMPGDRWLGGVLKHQRASP